MPWWHVPDKATGATYTEEMWDKYARDNLNFLEQVAYEEFISNVSITGTTEAAANQIVSAGAIDFEAVPHLIEFSTPRALAPLSQVMQLVLFDGSSAIGQMVNLPGTSPAANFYGVVGRQFTPSAGSHTYSIRGHVGGGSGTVVGGAGGAGAPMPGYIRIARVPTAS